MSFGKLIFSPRHLFISSCQVYYLWYLHYFSSNVLFFILDIDNSSCFFSCYCLIHSPSLAILFLALEMELRSLIVFRLSYFLICVYQIVNFLWLLLLLIFSLFTFIYRLYNLYNYIYNFHFSYDSPCWLWVI